MINITENLTWQWSDRSTLAHAISTRTNKAGTLVLECPNCYRRCHS
jgi:hypothetical protein